MKEVYLNLLKLLPSVDKKVLKKTQKNADLQTPQVAYIMSFAENDGGLIEELAKRYGQQFLLCYTPSMAMQAQQFKRFVGGNLRLAEYAVKELLFGDTFRLLKSTPVIIVDNYFAELAVFPREVPVVDNKKQESSLKADKSKKTIDRSIIQIWHASGAIKCFGWEDPKTAQRSLADKQRFQRVYDSFTDIVVGSDAMAEVFKQSWHVSDKVIRSIGVPRTDQFKPTKKTSQHTSNNTRKRILYVPTYRDTVTELKKILLNAFFIFYREFSSFSFFVKLHPHVLNQLTADDRKVLSCYENVSFTDEPLRDLIATSDVLITDYSSCVFDFMLRKPDAPYLFFCPDLDVYSRTTGLQKDFLWEMSPLIATSVEQLQRLLIDTEKHLSTASHDCMNSMTQNWWHRYNDGYAVERLLDLISARLS